jgi:hypothetical protein
VKIPTLIVHGENDTKFYASIETLKQIPTSEILMIKNASHACYIQQPIEFHNGLRQFLYTVYRPIFIEQYKNRAVSLTHNSSLLSSSLISNITKLDDNEENKGKKGNGKLTSNKRQSHND